MPNKKLLFFVTEDWYFCSHRLELAIAAKREGFDVSVVTRVREHGQQIREAGIHLIPFENARGGLNPLLELATLWRLVSVYRRIQPDVLHHVAMKPVLYGSIAARFASAPRRLNALAGMGWLFTPGAGVTKGVIKTIVRKCLGELLQSGIVVVQNPDDAELLTQMGVPSKGIRQIPGSGVDLEHFQPVQALDGPPMVLLPARLLRDKGVCEFAEAARILKGRGVDARFVLAGAPDSSNPASLNADDIKRWVDQGVLEHCGWVEDMPRLLAKSHIVCLPSYREGLPKSLIEAAAAGRPIVTTDVPGCREVVEDGQNGFLIPPRDPGALADALEALITDRALRETMGARGRIRAENEFGIESIIHKTLELYGEAAA